MSKATEAPTGPTAAKKIDELVEGLGDWREDTLAQVRRLIHEAVPDVVETWKWMGSPVWETDGILAVGNAHKQKVKLTFPQGAQLPDPEQVFNNGLGGKAWRAIDLREGDALDAAAFQALVRAAASYNADQTPGGWSHPQGRGPSDRRRFRGPGAQEGSKGVKTMTCRQLGGVCDLEHKGEAPDDVIKAQDRHLKEAEKAGDASHQEARDAMKSRWRHPKRSMDWYRDIKTKFSYLPES